MSDTLKHDTTVRLIRNGLTNCPLLQQRKQKVELARAFMAFYTGLTPLNVGILKDKVYPNRQICKA